MIRNTEKAKYNTKNNRIYSGEVFLAAINQSKATTSSIINLRLIATKVYMVCSFSSLPRPRRKINNEMNDTAAKENDIIRRSVALMFKPNVKFRIIPVQFKATNKMIRRKKYFRFPFIIL
jgi:hypothetical protein